MKIDINDYKETLRNEGYKLTNQRKEILNVLIDHRNEHLNCDEIFDILVKDNPEFGIATVYRTLQLFEKLDIVYKVNFDDGYSRYELNIDSDGHHHHHLICLDCGEVIEVKVDLLDSLEKTIEKEENFTIIDHNVKFYGYCIDCRES